MSILLACVAITGCALVCFYKDKEYEASVTVWLLRIILIVAIVLVLGSVNEQ